MLSTALYECLQCVTKLLATQHKLQRWLLLRGTGAQCRQTSTACPLPTGNESWWHDTRVSQGRASQSSQPSLRMQVLQGRKKAALPPASMKQCRRDPCTRGSPRADASCADASAPSCMPCLVMVILGDKGFRHGLHGRAQPHHTFGPDSILYL